MLQHPGVLHPWSLQQCSCTWQDRLQGERSAGHDTRIQRDHQLPHHAPGAAEWISTASCRQPVPHARSERCDKSHGAGALQWGHRIDTPESLSRGWQPHYQRVRFVISVGGFRIFFLLLIVEKKDLVLFVLCQGRECRISVTHCASARCGCDSS